MNVNQSQGAYFILGIIVVGWILGIIVPPLSAWIKSCYLGMWAGPNTARYRWKGYWWGYNKKTRNAFLILNDRRGNFQIQTWRPRFAIWGVFPKRRARIGLKQYLAKRFGVEACGNTWYGPDVKHPYNINVYLPSGASIAIGSMGWIDVIKAIRYANSIKTGRTEQPRAILANVNTLKIFCECESFHCDKHVVLELTVLTDIRQRKGFVLVDGCKTGPSKGDILVEQRTGYAIYREPAE